MQKRIPVHSVLLRLQAMTRTRPDERTCSGVSRRMRSGGVGPLPGAVGGGDAGVPSPSSPPGPLSSSALHSEEHQFRLHRCFKDLCTQEVTSEGKRDGSLSQNV